MNFLHSIYISILDSLGRLSIVPVIYICLVSKLVPPEFTGYYKNESPSSIQYAIYWSNNKARRMNFLCRDL